MTSSPPARPKLFIGSSTEGLKIAYAVQENLDHEAEITVWPQGVFDLSVGAVDSLLRILEDTDFGAFIFTPDDLVKLRGKDFFAARDNVVFELGMFIGRLGRQRSFIIMPRGTEALHLPSDLVGLTPATYEPNRSDNNLQAALGAACNQLRRAIQQLGPVAGPTKVLSVQDPSELVLKGLNRAAQFIARAIGPHGLAMAVSLEGGTQVVTKSGSMIARGISAEGFESHGVREIREVTLEMDNAIGDGAKIAALLTAAMVERGHKAVAAGHLPRDVVEGMRHAVEAAKAALDAQKTQTNDKAQIRAVASTAACSQAIGELVVNAMEAVGSDGIITVYESAVDTARVETLEGIEFDRGFISRHFVTDPMKMEAVLNDAFILFHDRKISSMKDLLPILEKVAQLGQPLLIIADDIQGEALATLVVNVQRGVVRLAAVRAPGTGERGREMVQDIAILTGGQVLSEDVGIRLENAVISDLGRAKRIVIDKDKTIIVGGAGEVSDINLRAASLRAEITRTTSDYDRELLQQRLARLVGGVASIVVGGITFSDTFEAKYQVVSAMHSARKAVESGIVVGGGKALINLKPSATAAPSRNSGETAGVDAVGEALESPLRALVGTTKADEGVVFARVKASGPNVGFNALTGEVEDLLVAGVVDPELMLSRALDVALAHTRRILLTDSWDLSA